MTTRVNYGRLGMFVILAIVSIVTITVLLAKGRLFSYVERYVIYFPESARGLNLGAPVRFKGIPLGTVVDMQAVYVEEQDTIVTPVFIEVDRTRIRHLGIPTSLPSEQQRTMATHGIRAILETDSLVTGQRSVSIEIKPDTPVKFVGKNSDIPEIAALPSVTEELTTTLDRLPISEIGSRLNGVLASLDTLISSSGVKDGTQQIGPLLQNAKESLQSLTNDLTPLIKKLGGVEYDALSRELREGVRSLSGAAKEFEILAREMRPLVPKGAASVEEVHKTMQVARELFELLQRRPEVLVQGKR
jgi:paraquat-inducible protein B